MYARVVKIQIQPDKIDDAIGIFQNSVVPAAKQQKGLINLMLLTDIDRTTGKGIAIGFWESEADLRDNEANGYLREQLAKFGTLSAAPPVVEEYAVTVKS